MTVEPKVKGMCLVGSLGSIPRIVYSPSKILDCDDDMNRKLGMLHETSHSIRNCPMVFLQVKFQSKDWNNLIVWIKCSILLIFFNVIHLFSKDLQISCCFRRCKHDMDLSLSHALTPRSNQVASLPEDTLNSPSSPFIWTYVEWINWGLIPK